jgi:hypothetical protein
MLSICRSGRRLLAAALMVFCVPAAALAQAPPPPNLKVPTIAASVAAAADWASTYHALKNYHVRESNPLLRPLDSKPGRMISLGAAIDVGLVSTWNVTVGRKHPRVAAAGLWAMAAFRSYLVIHNLRNQGRAERR